MEVIWEPEKLTPATGSGLANRRVRSRPVQETASGSTASTNLTQRRFDDVCQSKIAALVDPPSPNLSGPDLEVYRSVAHPRDELVIQIFCVVSNKAE